ncbi:uncharacterized protein OCT59_024526 [Rhizophagus irregularis]|uniref:Uncharacterized protein n=2 Tax=Rhizophagus irregularis TaxID=588596 RepID=A0A2N1NQD5_9GLOM|nr:hypothetical protein GLOIN_2v1771552 [Rhizophagus irregularis DAOM 181602=DAOM 197198]PKK76074.1 hypothetical protein RhiirC2_845480 [Rhizophagus irregularis]POG74328.1 hypothetical protein GLOIN_2v1771552 [Rhizophagus irregularis DAOM 181602=DAOM 197198]UZO04132.1 hypothetical protein OCT59_024526 [Rhizophagus irregularis]CAB4395866.1 unnamed protein product [Rhizophagus irregularis]CAB5302180.1 unnamed protein product [Rhizophagus irregularis]|eukprot:XP_025181194.1 hypothetical protein GLOIN_2v1771552 [Rhizophagus irregularis DAOM 181602=DAOM 197198]
MRKSNQAIRSLSSFSLFTHKNIGFTSSLTRSKRLFPSQFIPGFTLRVSVSSSSPSPPGPPKDPIPTPDPTDINPPINNLPPPKKTGYSITFPWLYGNQSPRIKHYPYPITNFWTSIISLLPAFFQHELCKWAMSRMLKSAVSAEYFPEQFLQGAAFAARQVCTSLSTPSERDELQDMLTTRFYDRIITELDKLESEKSSITIDMLKIYGLNIRDVWMSIGPKKAYSNTKKEYRILKWMTMKLAIRNTPSEGDFNESRAKVAKSFSDGINFKVDVEIDADMQYILKSAKNEIFINDQSRRLVLFRFESLYFEPADRIYYKVSSDNGEESNWTWRVGDIDYLLEIEDLENEMREEKDSNHSED